MGKVMEFRMCAPCLFGVEGLVADELRAMGAQGVSPQNGRVLFSGGAEILCRANLNSRYSERIQIFMGTFTANSFEDLFQGTRSLPWESWIGKLDSFPVKGRSLNSKLSSIPACQSIVKKAVVERLKQHYRVPWFEETAALYQIQFLIMKDQVSLMIDTSGAGLHKRGYRANGAEAPIKETLAAAMIHLSRIRGDSLLIDPFCGSGTLLIEGACYAKRIAPGLRRHFISESWNNIAAEIWHAERDRARAQEIQKCDFCGFGYDIDDNAIALTMENARKAGVDSCIRAEKREIKQFDARAYQRGVVVCNPPYGERLLDINSARMLYHTMGEVFQAIPGHAYSIISPDEEFEKRFGRKADKRRKLYNGMIRCQVYQYFR
jgi:putative N6-adenine-specific DNA methylase